MFYGLPVVVIKRYIRLVQNLIDIKESGLKSWFDGLFVIKYNDEAEVHQGASAAILRLSILGHPNEAGHLSSIMSNCLLDLNIAYQISLLTAREVLDKPLSSIMSVPLFSVSTSIARYILKFPAKIMKTSV